MKKLTVALVFMLILLVSTFGSISAITDGVLDGNGHPQVVLLLMEVGGKPARRGHPTFLPTTSRCPVITAKIQSAWRCAPPGRCTVAPMRSWWLIKRSAWAANIAAGLVRMMRRNMMQHAGA